MVFAVGSARARSAKIVPLLAVILALGAALVLRYGWIEPAAYGHACSESSAPWWCLPRQAVIALIWTNALGVLSVAAAAWAAWVKSRPAAIVAMAAGAAGLILYCYEWSAVGFLGGLLVFVRQREGGRAKHDQAPQQRIDVREPLAPQDTGDR